MRTIIQIAVGVLLIVNFNSQKLTAQTESYLTVLEDFTTAYNNKDVQGVFGLFDSGMQQSVNEEVTTQIIQSFHLRFGNLKSVEFSEQQGTRELYIAHFERGKQMLHLSLAENGKMDGLLFKPFENENSPGKIERNITALQLPFRGKWFTVWGGDTKAQNYHVVDRAQRSAFDFLIIGKGNKTYERSGTRNEDYFAFGQPIFAVCDGEVIDVITGVHDNKPGTMNPAQMLGNSVTLKTANDEYIVYAHFEKGTVKVKEGDTVRKGQLLGNCGNSGNSSEAHLHIHIQDGPDIYAATGVKCYFESLMVKGELKEDYSPVRLDIISAVEE